MVAALIKLTQDVVIGGDGEALIGNTAANVVISNVSNTGVGSWEIWLLEVPYGSGVATGALAAANGSTPSGLFAPDVTGGCWRLKLTVWPLANQVGTPDIDIRNFGVLGSNGFLAPPPQIWPEPLPDPASGLPGAKPNEMNFGGQGDGWAGSGTDGLLRHLIRTSGSAIGVIKADGSVSFAADQSIGGHKLTNVATPTTSTDAATKAYVDAHSGGSGRGFPFTYSATTADADPGAGLFRGNNATLASSTQLFIDDVAANGATGMSAWIASFDDQVGTVKGILRVQSSSDPTKFIEWPVTGITTASGYSKVALGTGWGPGGIVVTAGDTLLSFDAEGVSANLNNQALTNARYIALNGEVDNVSSGAGTKNIDWTAGTAQKIEADGNATITFTLPPGPMGLQLKITQDVTGGRVFTWPVGILGTAPTLSTVGTSVDFVGLYYDGTNIWWDNPILKNANWSSATADRLDGSKVTPNFGTQALTAGKGTFAPPVETSGSPYAVKITGAAHTTLTASTQAPDVDLVLARAVQFATGALTAQRAVRITAPTYGFVGASTITDAATVAISGPPVAGTLATLTRTFPLWVESGLARFDGGIVFGGASMATVGNIRGGSSFSIAGLSSGAVNCPLVSYDGTTNVITLGPGNVAGIQGFLQFTAAGTTIKTATNNGWDFTTTSIINNTNAGRYSFGTGATAPSFTQETTGTGSGTGQPMIFMAQPASGATSTGGFATFSGGDVTGNGSTGGAGLLKGGDSLAGASGTRTGGNTYMREGRGVTANGNMGLGVDPVDAVNFQSMQGGIYLKSAVAAPSADPSGGIFHWSDSGAPMWRYATNTRVKFGAAAATASAGAGTLPATPEEFWTITLNGNTRKIPCYLT